MLSVRDVPAAGLWSPVAAIGSASAWELSSGFPRVTEGGTVRGADWLSRSILGSLIAAAALVLTACVDAARVATPAVQRPCSPSTTDRTSAVNCAIGIIHRRLAATRQSRVRRLSVPAEVLTSAGVSDRPWI